MRSIRPLVRATLVLSFLGGAGCAGVVAPVIEEPLRATKLDDISPEALGLRRGVSTIDEARRRLRARGATGVTDDVFVPLEGSSLAVLTADYQSRIHVFENGKYEESLVLPTQGFPPYGISVRLGSRASGAPADVLLVVARPPLEEVPLPPALLVFERRDGAFALSQRIPLDAQVARHGGLSRPRLIGNNLSDGVLLMARDREGALWDAGYFVRDQDATLALEAVPIREALRCACVQKSASSADR